MPKEETTKEETLERDTLRLVLSPDGLHAWLEGADPDEQDAVKLKSRLSGFIQEAGIRVGLKVGILEDAVAALLKGEVLKRFVVASGTPPKPGRDGRIEYMLDLGERPVGRIDKYGKIDFRDRGLLPLVRKDQLLARLIEPTKGEPGLGVTGAKIPPPEPLRPLLEAGHNVKLVENELFSKADGQVVELSPGKVAVLDVLDLKNVDFKSGHVTFHGLVCVEGVIETGFKVKANMVSAGHVEKDALIKAEKSVEVDGGIIGAKVICDGDVKAIHVRQSNIECGGNLIVESEIVDSEVMAGGKVIMTSPQGRIINSRITVGQGVETVDLLSAGANPTQIFLGLAKVPPQVLKEARREIAKAEKAYERIEHELQSVWVQIDRTTEDEPAETESLAADLGRLAAEEAEANKKVEELEANLPRRPGEAYLSVTGTADRTVEIQGIRANTKIKHPLSSFTAREVKETDPDTNRRIWVISLTEAGATGKKGR